MQEAKRDQPATNSQAGGGETHMTVVHIIGWSVVAAVVSWRLAWHRARTMFEHVVTQAHAESRQLRAEVARWKTNAIRLSKEIDAWKAGHLEGRADVVSIVPMLIAARQESAACTCAAADQISTGM
jgi:lysozyme family protein